MRDVQPPRPWPIPRHSGDARFSEWLSAFDASLRRVYVLSQTLSQEGIFRLLGVFSTPYAAQQAGWAWWNAQQPPPIEAEIWKAIPSSHDVLELWVSSEGVEESTGITVTMFTLDYRPYIER